MVKIFNITSETMTKQEAEYFSDSLSTGIVVCLNQDVKIDIIDTDKHKVLKYRGRYSEISKFEKLKLWLISLFKKKDEDSEGDKE